MNILLSGATGAMGQVVAREAALCEDLTIVCGWADEVSTDFDFPVVTDLDEVPDDIDVIVDFSSHATAPVLTAFALQRNVPMVVATTGHTEAETESIQNAAKKIAIFQSGNMSIGVYVLQQLTEMVAKALEDFDIEVIEAHHNKKIDAPSGTAKMLVGAAKKARPELKEVYGRSGHTGRRATDEIGVHAIRGGTIVGEHQVVFAGGDEMVEIKHTALSKAIFAKGALKACRFVANQAPGLYNMGDLNLT